MGAVKRWRQVVHLQLPHVNYILVKTKQADNTQNRKPFSQVVITKTEYKWTPEGQNVSQEMETIFGEGKKEI